MIVENYGPQSTGRDWMYVVIVFYYLHMIYKKCMKRHILLVGELTLVLSRKYCLIFDLNIA